ncbi:MAG: hypothetical protein ACI9UR_002667, partial [Bacteroidia bacterium]
GSLQMLQRIHTEQTECICTLGWLWNEPYTFG